MKNIIELYEEFICQNRIFLWCYHAFIVFYCVICMFYFFTSSKQPNCRLINLFIQYAVLRLIGMHNEKNIFWKIVKKKYIVVLSIDYKNNIINCTSRLIAINPN